MKQFVIAVVLTFSVVQPVAAGEAHTETKAKSGLRFSIGSGLSWGNSRYNRSLLYEYSIPSHSWAIPSFSAFAELQMSRRFSWLLSLSGSIGRDTYDTDQIDGKMREIDINLGGRILLNPEGAVKVSIVAILVGNWYKRERSAERKSYEDDEIEIEKSDLYEYGVGICLGIAFERKLTDNLYLRFDTDLIEGMYSYGIMKNWTEAPDNPNEQIDKSRKPSRSMDARFTFRPTISMRLVF